MERSAVTLGEIVAAGRKHERLAAQQQQMAAAAQRSTAEDLQHRADEIDPDT